MSALFLLLAAAVSAAPASDPYLWLEEVEGPRAIEWVKAKNALSEGELAGDARYKAVHAEVYSVLTAEDRLPAPALRGGKIYNFWQDKKSVRGIWRRTTVEEYAKKQPKWELLLDLDALAAKEKENWVWKGSNCLPPAHDRCLLMLSRGGKDALVLREFDVPTRAFVKKGFVVPEAKSDAAWVGPDAILVATDFGPGSMTESGYPRTQRLWTRGQPLTVAPKLYEGQAKDVGVWAGALISPWGKLWTVSRSITFWTSEKFLWEPGRPLAKIPLPDDAEFIGLFEGRLLASLRSPWKAGREAFPAGAVVSLPRAAIGKPKPEEAARLVWAPDERSSFAGLAIAKDAVYLVTLQNVKGRVLRATPAADGWALSPVPLPENGEAEVLAADAFDTRVILRYQDFLTPATVFLYDGAKPAEGLKPLRRLPERFDSRGFGIEQFEADSRDGTKIPYFLVRSTSAPRDGSQPTLLYGYGGFEHSMTPYYLETVGKAWLSRGGAYALANIRGGGEFGPKWHQAALKENRQKSYDDFIAVAEDLIRRKATSPRRLGIEGGSNGGLLVGAVMAQRPELFRAVACWVPLLDMLRFHKLLAGASWVGEYGDPEDPKMAKVLSKYSPYQNWRKDAKYPRALFITSTKDDRVHPGHARKSAARLEELGHPFVYYENIEGGHGAAANLEQKAKMTALKTVYLIRQLID